MVEIMHRYAPSCARCGDLRFSVVLEAPYCQVFSYLRLMITFCPSCNLSRPFLRCTDSGSGVCAYKSVGVFRLSFTLTSAMSTGPFPVSIYTMDVSTTGIVAVLLILFWMLRNFLQRSRLPLPPGPSPWPLIGNILDMPLVQPWERFRDWCHNFRRGSF